MSFFKKLFSRMRAVKTFPKNRVLKFNKSDYDTTYKISLALLRMIGIRLTNNDSRLAKLLWNGFYVFEFVSLILMMVLEIIHMLLEASKGIYTDVYKITPCIGFIILAMVKTCNVLLNQPVYDNLILELRDMWPQEAVTEEEYNVIRPKLTSLNRFAKGYWYCNAALLTMFGLFPFITSIQKVMGYDVPLTFVVSFWCPFDPFKHGRFEFLALIQTWLSFLVLAFLSGTDILYCAFVSHITTQFDLLAIRIKKMFYVRIDEQLIEAYPLAEYSKDYIKGDLQPNNTNNYEKTCRRNIIDIVLRHRALTRLSADIENEFSFSLFINFMNSSILICFCGFCCMFVEKWNELNYKLFMLSANIQIWLVCWYGQNLIDSSKRVSDAIYCCGWYNVPKNIKSSLIIMSYRTQKVIYLSTYGFSVVSLENYGAILKTSLSYLMLLKNIYEK